MNPKYDECIKDCDKAMEGGREFRSEYKMVARALTSTLPSTKASVCLVPDSEGSGIKVRGCCPVSKSEKGKLALSISVKSIELFTKYFSMPYILPKLDMVDVPEFSGGAMENYGSITYCKDELLHDDLNSATSNTHRVGHVYIMRYG
ncbi:aminopeptidase M1-like protein isoform X1 [Tanacetum coccineum]